LVSFKIVLIIFLTIILLTAAINDFRFQKIPNWLTLFTVTVGVILHTCTSGWKGFFFSIGGMFLGLALLMAFYLKGGMGAGDVKLMGAVGGILGPGGVFAAFLGTALIGGVYAIALLALGGEIPDLVSRYGAMLKTFFFTHRMAYIPPAKKTTRPALRYGVAIAIGTMLSVFIKGI